MVTLAGCHWGQYRLGILGHLCWDCTGGMARAEVGIGKKRPDRTTVVEVGTGQGGSGALCREGTLGGQGMKLKLKWQDVPGDEHRG